MCEIGGGSKIFLSKRPAPPPGRVGAGFSGEHSILKITLIDINILFLEILKIISQKCIEMGWKLWNSSIKWDLQGDAKKIRRKNKK